MTDVDSDASHNSPFEAMAPTYERWADPMTTAFAVSALDRMNLEKGARVLDVGAGAGGPAVAAAARGCRVVALDNAPALVTRLRQRLAPFPRCTAEMRSLYHLDYAPASFDLAMSILCVAFFADAPDILRAMARVTRPGGFVCLANWTTEFGGPQFKVLFQALKAMGGHGDLPTSPGVSRLLSATEMQQVLRDAGCVDVSVEAAEAPCPLPEPSIFLDELDVWFTRMPAFSRLAAPDRERLQTYIERAYDDVPLHHGVHVLPATVHIAIGSVGRA